MLKSEKGFSLPELLVAVTVGFILFSASADVLIVGNKIVKEENKRIATNDESRLAFTRAIERLRDSATVIQNNDLDYDGVTDLTPLGVNFKLNDSFTGEPMVRDGLLVYTDEQHVTIFFDSDPASEPGHFYPDVVGFDDRNGNGKSDLIGIGLVPQDRDGNGKRDEIPRNSFTDERLPVVTNSGSNGYSPYYWKLVLVVFDDVSQVQIASKWKNGRALACDLVPYIKDYNTTNERYDVFSYEGGLAGYHDYGHDGVFETYDPGEGDGIVDEIELGYTDWDSFDGYLNTAHEIRNIQAVKIRLRKVAQVDPVRLDISAVETSLTPRAFAMVLENKLRFPIPVI